MLTSEVKNRINTCRDILVGKLPDPKSQVLQITNALIYKFMDDQDRLAEKLGGKPSFFINELKLYAWYKLFDSKLSNQDKADLYISGIEKLSHAEHLPELFRSIFKEAFVPFRAAGTIVMFIEEINKFDYHHSEELGNAYEYLLSIMGSQGDAGQFRTPRHIIEFLVDIVDPKKDETIYDPAAGTAGFLIAAYKHIVEANNKLTATEKKKLAENIRGVDIDPGMAKVARVNLYLHGFNAPHIDEGDTLTDEPLWENKYDIILANPPFMSPKGGIKPHDRFAIKANRSEVLFVDYIAEHLKLKGRAGVIVPEGIMFQAGTAYKQLRKMLVDDGFLTAVISLPAGVFQPYSGVKTSILILDRERAKQADEILFLKIENDGFSQSTQRSIRKGSELDEALGIVRAWNLNKKTNSRIATFVSKTKIADGGEYNLSGARYLVATDYSSVKWPMFKLGDLFEMQNGRAFKKEEWDTKGLPIIRIANLNAENSGYNYYDGNYDRRIEVNNDDLLFSWSGTVGTSFGPNYWTRGKGLLNQHIFKLETKLNNIDKKFAYFILKSLTPEIEAKAHGAGGLVHVTKLELSQFKIPVPPIEIQEQIVAELDGYQNIISGAKQVVQNWRPKINIDPEWEKVKISDVCRIERGASPRPIEKFITEDPDGFNWIKIGDTKNADKYIIQTAEKISKEGAEKSRKVFIGDFVLSNSMSFGHPYIMKIEGYIHDGWLRLSEDKSRISKHYLYYILGSTNVMEQFENAATGGVVRNLNSELVRNVVIPLPSLGIQKLIVEQIEAEKFLIDSSKSLIEIYEQKTRDAIIKLWDK